MVNEIKKAKLEKPKALILDLMARSAHAAGRLSKFQPLRIK